MKQDRFEEEFQGLPWHKPSRELDERITVAARESEGTVIRLFFGRSVALGQAAALVLCAGLIGYGLGRVGKDVEPSAVYLGQTDLRIIETGESANFFDLGGSGQQLLPGSLEFEVQETEGAGI